jgi:hypothetical protein
MTNILTVQKNLRKSNTTLIVIRLHISAIIPSKLIIFSMYTLKFVYEKLQHTTCSNLIRTTAFLFRQDPVFSQIPISYKASVSFPNDSLLPLYRSLCFMVTRASVAQEGSSSVARSPKNGRWLKIHRSL